MPNTTRGKILVLLGWSYLAGVLAVYGYSSLSVEYLILVLPTIILVELGHR
jgi:hypothetical protein